jgi:hypothetical protein
VALAEGGDQPGHEVVGGAGHGDGQPAAREALHLVDDHLRFRELGGDGAGVVVHLATRVREEDALAHLLEQGQPHVLLQLLDLHGDRRLGQVQLLRGPGEAQVPGHRLEGLELPEGEVHHVCPPRPGSGPSSRHKRAKALPAGILSSVIVYRNNHHN